ncbi:hypothetical protein [Paraburkholderia sp. SIMBA_030]|uniref:hypothetical protein n=1 Tax=Paraburkholderia sp. SIMBA_030 TaxID=3085773 RepID=UPI00397B8AC7
MSKPSNYVTLIAREQTSTGRLHKLLDLAERKFPEFKNWPGLQAAVNSQGELAQFADDGLQIASCSLNTLKKRANDEIGVGWERLDSLRRRVAWKFQKQSLTCIGENRPGRGSKAELELKLKEVKDDYRQLESDNWQLVKGIRGLLKLLDSLVEQYPHDALSKQVQTERAEVLAMFNLLNQPKVFRNETSEG